MPLENGSSIPKPANKAHVVGSIGRVEHLRVCIEPVEASNGEFTDLISEVVIFPQNRL